MMQIINPNLGECRCDDVYKIKKSPGFRLFSGCIKYDDERIYATSVTIEWSHIEPSLQYYPWRWNMGQSDSGNTR